MGFLKVRESPQLFVRKYFFILKFFFYLKTTILAWHDMLVHMSDRDAEAFNLSKILEPILW